MKSSTSVKHLKVYKKNKKEKELDQRFGDYWVIITNTIITESGGLNSKYDLT